MPLSPARRAEIEGVFEAALDLDPALRRAWLSDRCVHDAELRAEVEALLAAHESPVGILERRLVPAMTALAAEPLRDRRIGPTASCASSAAAAWSPSGRSSPR